MPISKRYKQHQLANVGRNRFRVGAKVRLGAQDSSEREGALNCQVRMSRVEGKDDNDDDDDADDDADDDDDDDDDGERDRVSDVLVDALDKQFQHAVELGDVGGMQHSLERSTCVVSMSDPVEFCVCVCVSERGEFVFEREHYTLDEQRTPHSTCHVMCGSTAYISTGHRVGQPMAAPDTASV
eukprot:911420-Rhodomonas_salina.4